MPGCPPSRRAGCPIRTPPDRRPPAPPRGVSPQGRVLPRPPAPRHPPCALLRGHAAVHFLKIPLSSPLDRLAPECPGFPRRLERRPSPAKRSLTDNPGSPGVRQDPEIRPNFWLSASPAYEKRPRQLGRSWCSSLLVCQARGRARRFALVHGRGTWSFRASGCQSAHARRAEGENGSTPSRSDGRNPSQRDAGHRVGELERGL